MKKLLFTLVSLMCTAALTLAQTTILDFETPGTSTVFQYFGSPLDGTFNSVVPNPAPGGINPSSMVSKFVKPAVAEVWAGAFSNPNPTTVVDLTTPGKVAIKVWMDHIGSLSLKLESPVAGGDSWLITVPNTKVNEWEELQFDPTLPSLEAPFTTAAGHAYARVTLFFDFGAAGTGSEVTSYFDDIVVKTGAPVITPILDFETAATGTKFQYFGSPLDGTFTQIVDNPQAAGLNTSAKVVQFIKPAVAEVWAGAFSNPNPTTPVDLSSGGQVCIKVWMDHIGNLALKLENSTSGQPNWIQKVANTKVNEWEELCFDVSLPSLEAPFAQASGVYQTITLFFDFGTAGTGVEVTNYLDDIVVKSSGAPAIRTVKFKVDMNNYTSNFDKVYLSGTFNNWSGDANPLSDDNFDGIWEGTLMLPNGAYEYKVTLDNWAAQEQFAGTEECTKTDPSGQFTNRLLPVGADITLPQFCFNSCYACGQEAKITFRLGMGIVPPNPDGVWLAGGGNFDVPGGRYKMKDPDNDGIYEIVVPRKKGFGSHYAFANGPCPDYSCKENLAGLPCGDPNSFNDRTLAPVTQDTVVATCFGACNTNANCALATHEADAGVFELRNNPVAEGDAWLYFDATQFKEKNITLTDALGRTLQQWTAGAYDTTLRLPANNLQPGVYFVTVKMGNRFFTRKLIKA